MEKFRQIDSGKREERKGVEREGRKVGMTQEGRRSISCTAGRNRVALYYYE